MPLCSVQGLHDLSVLEKTFQNQLEKVDKGGTVDAQDFCSSMEIELTAWKAKLFDSICKADRLGSADKEKAMTSINDIKIIVADMEAKIHELKMECPSEWSPQKKDIDEGTVDLRSKYDETMDFIGKSAPMSIPG